MFDLFFGNNPTPNLKSDDAIHYLARIRSYLKNNYGNAVYERVFEELNKKLGLDVKGAVQKFVVQKTMDKVFQSQLPFKLVHASFNFFRTGYYNRLSDTGKNPYSPSYNPESYVDFMIWTWQNKQQPYFVFNNHECPDVSRY